MNYLILLLSTFISLNSFGYQLMVNDSTVTAQSVIEKYINAIGGEKRLKTVKTILIYSEVSFESTDLTSVVKKMVPNKEFNTIDLMDIKIVERSVFDGTNGYKIILDMRTPLSPSEIKQKQEDHCLFPELYYVENNYKLSIEGKEQVNNKDTYKVKIVSPLGFTTYKYYDVNSGLLLKQDFLLKDSAGKEQLTSAFISEYKAVEGILFPYVLSIGIDEKKLLLKSYDIKINQGVSEKDSN